MKKWKVVVSDWEFENLNYESDILNHEQLEVVTAQCKTEQEVIENCWDADAIINQYAPMSQTVIDALDNCKVIARYGVGVNTIDLAAATDKGICVTNVPDYCMDEVSDHALALILSWVRKVTFTNNRTKAYDWDFKVSRPIYRLKGRILGLVGLGKIPQRLAEKAQALGLNVIAYDPYMLEEVASQLGVQLVSLNELCAKADIISVHTPLTNETQGLISRPQFEDMKNEAFIVNTSRGPVIDEDALIEALRTHLIAGAALDVVEDEPISRDHPLLQMENVILTPHMAWYSEQAEMEMRSKVAMGVVDVLVYEQYPKYLVNHQVTDKGFLQTHNGQKRYEMIANQMEGVK